ncbi:MAG TPA: VOC family protein [Pseudolysinimonas sp.]|nr:glyoxalase [Schumannella sp.]HEV7741769.1 VOC family protein [Pseudolysinimonas sp.]
MTAALARILISVASLEQALPLYEGVLDLRRTRESPGIVGLGLARGIELMLHERPPTPGDAGVAPIFRVANVDATVKAALAAGASLVDAPRDESWGERQAVLHDIDGHVLCLVTPLD